MQIVTLARKAISESNVAKNLIQHWAGAVNIDVARVPRAEDYFEKCASVVGCKSNNAGSVYNKHWGSDRDDSSHELGAWPPNVILIHTQSCKNDGDGWVCISECPSKVLQDKARFFTQCAGIDALVSYLVAFLSPPCDQVLVAPNSLWDPEPGCPGLVVPWPVSLETMSRWLPLLRPGAHIAILSEDGIDVGCDLETAGYEIRDAILIGEEPKGLHYCAKAARKERDAGVPHSEAKMRVVRYFPMEDIDADCPKEGFPAEEVPPDLSEFFEPKEILVSRRHSNHHATVKPLELMSKIMAGLPPGSLVVDPFLGSGTTAVAALNRRLSCIGIEQDTEEGYVRIALARVEYWCPAHVVVRCEWEPKDPEEVLLWQ